MSIENLRRLRHIKFFITYQLDLNVRWPLIIDPNERVSAFLRHRDTNIVNAMDLQHMKGESVRVKLISALRYGKVFVIGIAFVVIF